MFRMYLGSNKKLSVWSRDLTEPALIRATTDLLYWLNPTLPYFCKGVRSGVMNLDCALYCGAYFTFRGDDLCYHSISYPSVTRIVEFPTIRRTRDFRNPVHVNEISLARIRASFVMSQPLPLTDLGTFKSRVAREFTRYRSNS